MPDRYRHCLALLWEGDPDWLGSKRGKMALGLTRRTVASWRHARVTDVNVEELQRGEASAILYSWFWRAMRADELAAGLDYALFEHAVYAGPKQAILDLQHIIGVRRPLGAMDGFTMRCLERQNPKTVIAGLASFRRDKDRAAIVAERALALLEAGHEQRAA